MIKQFRLWLSSQIIDLGIWIVGDDYIEDRIRMGMGIAGQIIQQELTMKQIDLIEEIKTPEDEDWDIDYNGPTIH